MEGPEFKGAWTQEIFYYPVDVPYTSGLGFRAEKTSYIHLGHVFGATA